MEIATPLSSGDQKSPGRTRPGPLRVIAVLTLAIVSVSFGSIFIRLASAPAIVVAAYRVFWAAILLLPWFGGAPARELRLLTRTEWLLLVTSGAALAGHFAFWITSLSYTSVATSVLLVDTTPVFVGLTGQFLLNRPQGRLFWIGLAAALLGAVILSKGDLSPNSTKGYAFALAGAAAMSAYLLLGARARQKLSLAAYVWPVYVSAAIILGAACIAAGLPLAGYSASTHFYLFLLGLVPQCLGHTSYNWSLRWLSPALVALIGLAEPVGAAILASAILHEPVSGSVLLGGFVILAGIYLAARTRELGT